MDFTDNWVYEKTGKHLETVEKDILRQTLVGKKLSAIHFERYGDSYVQRFLAPRLWKLLTYIAGERVTKITVLEVVKRHRLERSLGLKSRLQVTSPDYIRAATSHVINGYVYNSVSLEQTSVGVTNYRNDERRASAQTNNPDKGSDLDSTFTWDDFLKLVKPRMP